MTITASEVAPAVHQHDGRSTGERPLMRSIGRGLRLRCPACGEGHLFKKYLKVADYCDHCGEALYHQRADDAPPYVTIVIVGHVVVSLVLMVEVAYRPPLWVHAALWVPLTLILTLTLLPMVKGALVNLQWGLLMHGFDPNAPEETYDEFEVPADHPATFVPRP